MACWRFAVGLAALAGVAAAPLRVVSLNLCADDALMVLAPQQAVALTRLAVDPALSVVAGAARGVAAVAADAEAVLALHPDLVLAAEFGARPTVAALAAHGVRVERIRLPEDFAGIRDETRRLARLLGVAAQGEAVLADMDRRLAAIIPRAAGRATLRALWLAPRGWTSGATSLQAAVLTAAGLQPVGDGSRRDLEWILTHRPDVLVTASRAATPSLATDFAENPALDGIPKRRVDPALTLCPGPWSVAAVEALQ